MTMSMRRNQRIFNLEKRHEILAPEKREIESRLREFIGSDVFCRISPEEMAIICYTEEIPEDKATEIIDMLFNMMKNASRVVLKGKKNMRIAVSDTYEPSAEAELYGRWYTLLETPELVIKKKENWKILGDIDEVKKTLREMIK